MSLDFFRKSPISVKKTFLAFEGPALTQLKKFIKLCKKSYPNALSVIVPPHLCKRMLSQNQEKFLLSTNTIF